MIGPEGDIDFRFEVVVAGELVGVVADEIGIMWGEDHEVGAVVELVVDAVVIDAGDLPVEMLGRLFDDGYEIDVGIDDVDANQAVGGEVLLVDLERFFGE